MISFALAQELKRAGFNQPITHNAEYFLNENLVIRREDAIHMWYADKLKQDWELKVEEELVYNPTLTVLIEGCGVPFSLSSDATGHWHAKNELLGETENGKGTTPEEAVARLWLALRRKNHF